MIYERISENKIKSFGLIILFTIFILFLGWIFGQVTNFGIFGIIIAAIIAIAMSFGSYYYSDSIVLKISGAREVKKSEFPYLYNVIDGLSLAAGLPTPKKYVINDPALNAFATGRNPEHGVICVTTGLLEKLNRQELEGVIAHEMSHIKNYDTRLQTFTVVMVGIVSLMSGWILRSFLWGGGRRERDSMSIALIVIGLILALFAPIIATIIKLAVSRQREYLADADSALLTRYPNGLANALQKISSDKHVLRTANNATSHLYISNPFKKKGIVSGLFSTHPKIDERIKRLKEM